MSANLLVELFTEELPPKALKRLGEAFADGILNGLARAQLKTGVPARQVFATPRRLAVLIPDVLAKAEDRPDSKKLMPAKVAFAADGKPSAALLKRLEKEGAGTGQLERRTEGNAEYVFLNQTIPGITLAAGLQIALQEAIAKMPIPRVMGYQLADGATTVHFVRPVHGLIALHGNKVVDVSILGLKADRITHGHRFQGVKNIPVATADAYEEALAAHGQVIASFDGRHAEIARQLAAKSVMLKASLGAEADYMPLLDEVTALVEYPTVYAGEFDPEFLAVPQECLTLTMRQNQKYFPLFDAAGKLINRFLIVSNMKIEDPKNIIEGNQRVIRPRLADARFFFETDKKIRLADRCRSLALSSTTTNSARSSIASGGCAHWRGRLRRKSTPIRRAPTAPPCSPKPISSPTWSASSPSCKASWAATTRLPTAKTRAWRTPSNSTTGHVSPAMRCPATMSPPRSRWPTSWKPWPECSASASNRRETRIRLPCGVMRWD